MVTASRISGIGVRRSGARPPVLVLGALVMITAAAVALTFTGLLRWVAVLVILLLLSELISRLLWYLRTTRSVRTAARRASEPPPREYLVPRSLPPVPELLVGRSTELRELQDFLLDRSSRGMPAVVVIHGMPGIGRTTLALRLAHAIADRYRDGQVYAGLEGRDLTAPDNGWHSAVSAGLTTLVEALGDPNLKSMPAGFHERAVLYQNLARDKQILVVLDDARDEPELASLLPTGPGSAAIITSNGPISGVLGAVALEIGPLSEADGLTLLDRIVGAGRIARPLATRLVADCRGHPLAIRLVGIALTSYSGGDLNEAVERLVMRRHRGTSARDARLFGILDSAYSTLTADEQAALRCLGTMGTTVFAPWMFQAAAGIESSVCNVLVDRLTRAQLVTKLSGTSRRASLYRLSPAVLDYARDRASAEDEDLLPLRKERLARESQSRRQRTSQLGRAYRLAESGQLAEAITVTREELFLARDRDDSDAQARSNEALGEFYTELGYIADAHEAIAAALASGHRRSMAGAYRVRGRIARRQHRLAAAASDCDLALELIRATPEPAPADEARILGERAVVLAMMEKYPQAHADANRALDLSSYPPREPVPMCRALCDKATVYFHEGKPEDAAKLMARAHRLVVDDRYVLNRAWLSQASARVQLTAGNTDAAMDEASEGLDLFVRMSHRYGAAHCRLLIGQVFAVREEIPAAVEALQEALNIFRDCGGDWIEGWTSLELASCHRALDELDKAARLEASAAEIFAALGDSESAVHAVRGLVLPQLRRLRKEILDSVKY